MELTINLNESAIHDKGLSYYNHNYYKLKTPIFGIDYIKVIYYECSNNYDVYLGNLDCGAFSSNYCFDAECSGSTVTIYLE